jgi:mannose-6-phosphate isomerase-like protein (cupin superfamily)
VDARKLGQVADRVVFENERVRIWEMTLEPGEASDFHEHTLDYLLCVIEGESVDADFDGGRSIQIPVQPGTTIFVPKGNREVAVNRSAIRYHEILIELKES